ncbi:hypothetical protein B7C42_01670 [Nocardia cerradoensis]|uniref:Uncharacterized protein n=1 Tax=Nocardia cerradoensis TaxID=85688 RepID=A0A231HD45_9NOCA|nr:hypothetical protein [Nocardia cerradoensis]OXR46695.1 hypothetical protein B7C42_01670 [Nocardia cerradoensis]
MSGEAFGIVGIVVVCLSIIGIIVAEDIRARRDDGPQPAMRSLRPIASPSHHRAREYPPEWRCAPLRHPMSINRARFEMQDHRACSLDACPRKNQAHAVLVFAGKIIPQQR